MSNLTRILIDISEEMEKATNKFPQWPSDPNHAASIVMEEAGELDQAVMETIYEYPKSTKDDCYKEAIQTAVVAIRFLMSIDKYSFKRSDMHEQVLETILTPERIEELKGTIFEHCTTEESVVARHFDAMA